METSFVWKARAMRHVWPCAHRSGRAERHGQWRGDMRDRCSECQLTTLLQEALLSWLCRDICGRQWELVCGLILWWHVNPQRPDQIPLGDTAVVLMQRRDCDQKGLRATCRWKRTGHWMTYKTENIRPTECYLYYNERYRAFKDNVELKNIHVLIQELTHPLTAFNLC